MSGQKPKQQQSSLFSFFKKPIDANTKSLIETSNPIAAVTNTISEKKAPVSAGNVNNAATSEVPAPVKAKVSSSPKKALAPVSTEEKDPLLHDSDDESFALGKKRRLQKGPKEQHKSDSGSASKKPKLSTKTPPSSATKKAELEKKKGTIHTMDDDDEDAEFESSSGDEEGSNFSDDNELDDSSEIVNEDNADDSITAEEDNSDDDYYRRKKGKASIAKKSAPYASTKKTVAKNGPTTTPSKAAPSLPSSAYKTPTGKSSSLSTSAMSGIFSGAAKTPDQMSQGSAPTSASKIVLPEGVMGAGRHDHDSFTFLYPENIRDANNRRPGDSCYNPRTLKIPQKFLSEQTPAMAQ